MNNKPLRYFFFSPINSYDTFEADNYANMQVARNIYGTLVSDLIDGVPQGIVAESWDVSSDGKIWKFKIRKNLTFEDGSPLSPEIVLLNFKRILWLTRKEGLVLNSLLPEIQSWKSMNDESKSIFLNEKKELIFKFIHRPVSLLEAISQPIYGIAHPDCFDHEGKWKNIMSTIASGQYRISDRNEIQFI
jgi:ABC-type oligopeptide transport system substrate-binding subunit